MLLEFNEIFILQKIVANIFLVTSLEVLHKSRTFLFVLTLEEYYCL